MVCDFKFHHLYALYKGCISSIIDIQGRTKEFVNIIGYEHNLLKGCFKRCYEFLRNVCRL